MYLSDREILTAIANGTWIVTPPEGVGAAKVDPTSLDLRLDHVREAKIWDVAKLTERNVIAGFKEPVVRLGTFKYPRFADEYLIAPPKYDEDNIQGDVFTKDDAILVRPGGFLLWQTKEKIGTPAESPNFICFIDGKSTL